MTTAHRWHRPAPAIPTCCAPHRLHVIDALAELLAHDAYAAVLSMAADGWPAVEAVEAYRGWLLGRLAEAIDAGALFAEAAA